MRIRMNHPGFQLESALVSALLVVLLLPALGAQTRQTTPPLATRQKPHATVPNVVGLTVDQARNELANAKLVAGKITEVVHHGTVGKVYAQRPPARKVVLTGSKVDLWVVKNPRPIVTRPPLQQGGRVAVPTRVIVPNLSGQTQAQAAATLAGPQYRLRLGQVGTGNGHGTPGTVFAQNPQPGNTVLVGTAVNVTLVARAAPPEVRRVIVPNLSGQTQEQAAATLAGPQYRLRLGRVSTGNGHGTPGTVFAQNPQPGNTVLVGTAVHVTLVARAAPPEVRRVVVPNLTGQTQAQAAATLAGPQYRLRLGRVSTGNGRGTPGTVFAQDPPPGTVVLMGSTLNVTLVARAAPPEVRRVIVPNLSGQTPEQAVATLAGPQYRLRLGQVSTSSGRGTPGTVFTQEPQPGSIVLVGTAVNVTLVEQPKYTTVPSVIDLDADRARVLLGERRLSLGDVREEVSDRAGPGRILDQSPKPETRVLLGSQVNVTVARAPERVPPLSGYTLSQAESVLKEKSLRVGTVREGTPETPQAAGTIFSQDPQPGSLARPGQMVNVWIAQRLVSVPNLVGLDSQAARDALSQSDLRIGSVTEEAATGPPGRVVKQEVPPGTMVAPATPVNLVLSRAIAYAASVDEDPTNPMAGTPVTFRAHVTPEVQGTEYQFTFGDNQKSGWTSDPQSRHTYQKAGNFQLVVAVRAPGATIPATSLAVQIRRQAFAVSLSADRRRAYTNRAVHLTATLQPPSEQAEYRFDFGDGLVRDWTAEPTAEHQYQSPGNYPAFVQVRIAGVEPVGSAVLPLEIATFPWIPVVAGLMALAAASFWLYRKIHGKPPVLPANLSVLPKWDLGRQQIATSGSALAGPSLRIRAAPSIGEQRVEPRKGTTA